MDSGNTARRIRAKDAAKAGEPAFDLQTFLPYRMLIATDQVTRLFEIRYMSEFGISIPESRILNVLSNFSPISSREICELTAMSKPRVSSAVARLAASGLLLRELNSSDKRLLRLELTARGRKLHEAIAPVAREMEQCLTEFLDQERRMQLMTQLTAIEQRARKEISKQRSQADGSSSHAQRRRGRSA